MALKLITAGESHGPGLTCIVEGLPAGLELDREAIDRDMARRQLGHGRGGRMKIETDRAYVTAGVRHGRTLGGPVALQVANRDYANWEERMNPWPVEAEVPEVHLPRPGHADLVGRLEVRPHRRAQRARARQRARDRRARRRRRACAGPSWRRSASRCARTSCRSAREVAPAREAPLALADFDGVDDDPVRCLDGEASAAMVAHINVQRKANESIGGVFEVIAFGLVPGLGSHVSWEKRLDGRIAGAICSIQAVKGATLGEAFEIAAKPGSEAHDEIFYDEERGYYRETNRAGGLEGGMTTGEPLIVRGAMKPLPTLTQPLRSVDIAHARARAGAARAHRLVHRARRRRRGRGDGRLRARRRLPREVRRRPHRRRARRRRPLRGAHRVEDAQLSRSLVFAGFMGAGKSTLAREAARALGARAARHRRARRGRARRADRGVLGARGRGRRSASARSRSCSSALDGAPAVVALGGGALGSERVREALAAHVVVLLDVEPGRAWARVEGSARPLARDRDALRRAARRAPAALPRGGDRDACLDRADDAARARCRACSALAASEARGALRMLWAHERVGRATRSGSARGAIARGAVAAARALAADRRQRRERRRALRRAACRGLAGLIEIPAGRGAQDAGDRRARLARARRAGRHARRPPRRRRRRRRRRPRGLLRGDLPARHPGRPGADDARRAGRLGLRRQDRRRPAGGQELRRRLPPAGRGHRRPGDARDAAARPSSPPATPRSSRRR